MISTASQYGDSWDEKIRADSGERKLRFYKSLLSGNTEEAHKIASKTDHYPGFHDLTLTLIKRFSPLEAHLTGNLFSLFLGLSTIAISILIGRHLGGAQGGFWTMLFIFTLPRFYGHVFINPKDIPFAFGYIGALYFIIKWLNSHRVSWQTALGFGLFAGITMATRIGGLLVFCYLGLFIGIKMFICYRENKDPSPLKILTFDTLKKGIIAGIIASLITLAYWPNALISPIQRTQSTLSEITQFAWNMPVFFEGNFSNASDLPWYYLPKMLFLTIPEFVIVLFLFGLFFTVLHTVQKVKQKSPINLDELLLFFAALFPIGYIIIKDAIVYNGIRHILFVLPVVAIIAGETLHRLLNLISQKVSSPKIYTTAIIIVCMGILIPLISIIRLHPYQYIYYNSFAGGTAKASLSYETDYWGTSYKELAHRFHHYIQGKPTPSQSSIIVNMEHVTWLFEPFIPHTNSLQILTLRSRPEKADYYAANTLWGAQHFHEGITVVEVRAQGVLLAVVKDIRNTHSESD